MGYGLSDGYRIAWLCQAGGEFLALPKTLVAEKVEAQEALPFAGVLGAEPLSLMQRHFPREPAKRCFRAMAANRPSAGQLLGRPESIAARHTLRICAPYCSLSGTGTFSTTAIRMRSADTPFILASGLGVMRWASTGSTMRCTSSGKM